MSERTDAPIPETTGLCFKEERFIFIPKGAYPCYLAHPGEPCSFETHA